MIYLTGYIAHDGSTLVNFKADLDAHEGDHIHVEITSEGGDTDHAFAIYNRLTKSSKAVTTIANAQCCSAAVLVFAAGTTRVAYPNTTFMVHEFSSNSEGSTRRTRRAMDQQLKEQLLYAKLLAKNSLLSEQKWVKLMNEETYFNEREALKWGLVTKIL